MQARVFRAGYPYPPSRCIINSSSACMKTSTTEFVGDSHAFRTAPGKHAFLSICLSMRTLHAGCRRGIPLIFWFAICYLLLATPNFSVMYMMLFSGVLKLVESRELMIYFNFRNVVRYLLLQYQYFYPSARHNSCHLYPDVQKSRDYWLPNPGRNRCQGRLVPDQCLLA